MLSVPVRTELIAEIFVRSGGKVSPTDLIDSILGDYLDRTRGDESIWSEEHAARIAKESDAPFLIEFGDPAKGFNWQGVHLPNGSQLRVTYKRKEHFAVVRHNQVYYQDDPCSPSQFASRAAKNTSRNAWNDVWVKRPNDHEWIFANALRIALPDRFGGFFKR